MRPYNNIHIIWTKLNQSSIRKPGTRTSVIVLGNETFIKMTLLTNTVYAIPINHIDCIEYNSNKKK